MSSIVQLSCYRWTLPILAQLARSGGSRFVPLAATLGLSRDTLRHTLDALLDLGLVTPNPGYGHPSRPEYILTEEGQAVAPHCADLVEHVRRARLERVAYRKWSLPTIAALAHRRGFGEVRRAVGATPRALTLALKELLDAGLVARQVHDDFPPRTTYGLTARGRALENRVARLEAALAATAPAEIAATSTRPR